MDEGLAAWGAGVIAGVAGIAGTWLGGRQATKAARSQVREQAAADHGHWHREQRLAAYLDLLAEWDGAVADCEAIRGEADRYWAEFEAGRHSSQDPDEVFDHHWGRIRERLREVQVPMERLAMLAPEAVVASAERMRAALDPDTTPGLNLFTTWGNAREALKDARGHFVHEVRKDIGASPR